MKMSSASQPLSLEMKVGDGENTVLLDLLPFDGNLPSEKVETDFAWIFTAFQYIHL